jgi:protein-S-isoprenylcysteine O-methyltransferase Ste14
MPITYLLVAIVLCVALHFLVPVLHIVPTPWNLVGGIPVVFGVWINISADQALKRARTTVKPFEEPAVLIQEGIYRVSRNPMYLGFVSILIGISILLGTVSPFIVVLLFPLLMELIYIRIEERMLAEKFGVQWEQYRARVRKWI